MHLKRATPKGRHPIPPIRAAGYRTASRPIVLTEMPIEGYNRGTPDLYPRGSDKYLSFLTSPPRICRACRPTTRRHFAHTAIAMLCEMAKRRLLRCPFGLPGSALPCTVSPSVLLGHRSARGGPKGRRARLAAGGRPAAPDGRTPHLGMGCPRTGYRTRVQ